MKFFITVLFHIEKMFPYQDNYMPTHYTSYAYSSKLSDVMK